MTDYREEYAERGQAQKMQMSKPADALDLAYLEVEPAYGKEATQDFNERLQTLIGKAEKLYNPDGTPKLDKYGRQMLAVNVVHLWGELGFYTRDMRLGNLKGMNGDMEYCEHYLDLAGVLLNFGCPSAFTTAYRRVATKLELSQSRDGFYRKNKQTLLKKTTEIKDSNQKNWLGGQKPEYE